MSPASTRRPAAVMIADVAGRTGRSHTAFDELLYAALRKAGVPEQAALSGAVRPRPSATFSR